MKSIFFLSAATFHWLRSLVDPGPILSRGKTRCSCTVAVCVRNNDDIVLVDAGFSEMAGLSADRTLSSLTHKIFGFDASDQNAIVRQLQNMGFKRSQVKAVVATHCHFDHIGGLADFPEAELITTSEELSAIGDAGFQPFYIPSDLACQNPIRPIVLTGPRKYCMPASLDLFGDGEITLLDAEGHSPGHLAVAIRSSSAFYLHAGDALFLDWESGKGCAGPSRLSKMVCRDNHAMRRTLRNIQKLLASEDPPVVVPSHDMGVFESLPHSFEEGKAS